MDEVTSTIQHVVNVSVIVLKIPRPQMPNVHLYTQTKISISFVMYPNLCLKILSQHSVLFSFSTHAMGSRLDSTAQFLCHHSVQDIRQFTGFDVVFADTVVAEKLPPQCPRYQTVHWLRCSLC